MSHEGRAKSQEPIANSRFTQTSVSRQAYVSLVKAPIRRVLFGLLLGAVTTVAVAWVFALRVVVPMTTSRYVTADGLYEREDQSTDVWCRVKRRPGLLVVVWEPVVTMTARTRGRFNAGRLPLLDPYGLPGEAISSSGPPLVRPWSCDSQAVPRWGRSSLDLVTSGGTTTLSGASARGWPRPALWYEVAIAGGSRTNLGGIDVSAKLEPWLGPGPVLPCRFLPSGFAVDTALYGAVWFGLLFVPGYAVRARRRHRGLCPDCAYDLRHAEHRRCPECGWGEGTKARSEERD